MSSVSQLATLLEKQASLNYNTMQLNHWSAKYDANATKLQKQVKYEEDWEKAFDSAQDTDKECKIGNETWKKKGEALSDADADKYAHAKVKKYDEELSLELAELDVRYDTMKTMFEAQVTSDQAQVQSLKQSVATEMQDTKLLQS